MMPWCQTSLHKQGSLYYSENAHVKECKCGLKGSTVEIKASKLRTYRMPYYLVIWDLKIEKKNPHTCYFFFVYIIHVFQTNFHTETIDSYKTLSDGQDMNFAFKKTKSHVFCILNSQGPKYSNFLHCYVIFAYKL